MSAKGFASTGDMAEKTITFSEIGPDIYAFTAEGDPNTAVIVGDDGCIVFDAQATPAMAAVTAAEVRFTTGCNLSIRDVIMERRPRSAGSRRRLSVMCRRARRPKFPP